MNAADLQAAALDVVLKGQAGIPAAQHGALGLLAQRLSAGTAVSSSASSSAAAAALAAMLLPFGLADEFYRKTTRDPDAKTAAALVLSTAGYAVPTVVPTWAIFAGAGAGVLLLLGLVTMARR